MPGERKGKMTIDQLTATVLDLPPEQRALLREKLEDSLSPMDDIDPADLEEAHRRLDAMKSGQVKGVPVEDVVVELEKRSVSDLLDQAMQMPVDARAELAGRLIASLTGNRGFDPAWEAEMNRRIDEIEAGTAKTLSEEEFFEKLRVRRAARQVS